MFRVAAFAAIAVVLTLGIFGFAARGQEKPKDPLKEQSQSQPKDQPAAPKMVTPPADQLRDLTEMLRQRAELEERIRTEVYRVQGELSLKPSEWVVTFLNNGQIVFVERPKPQSPGPDTHPPK